MARRSMYQPLADYLASRTEGEVSLTFPEIEALLGGPLPTSAYVEGSYWSLDQFPAGRALRPFGWRGRIDRRHRRVCFTRDAARGMGGDRGP